MTKTYVWEPIESGAWSGAKYWSGSNTPRPDSYMVWADATRFVDIAPLPGKVDRVPILIELKEERTAKAWAREVKGLKYITVPATYARPPEELAVSRYCTAWVGKAFFAKMATEPRLRDWIERFEVGLPGSNSPPDSPLRKSTPLAANGRRSAPERAIVIATIDDNLAFAHARFRDADASHTRIEYFWDQGAASQSPPKGFASGRELSRDAIDSCIAAATVAGHVDEDRVYREACYDAAKRRLGHGTHTMDLAGGAQPAYLEGDEPRHIWVQFPARDNWGSSPLGVQVLEGLRYIIDRADSLGASRWGDANARPPVVVSLPHANLGGPHDGSTILERAMDELISLRSDPLAPLDIVLSAGNNHLSRCHAHFDVAAGRAEALEWRVLPDDATPNFLEIWVADVGDARDLRLHIVPPEGVPAARAPANGFAVGDVIGLKRGNDGIVCTVAFMARPGNGDGAIAFIAIGPTSTHRRPAGGAPAPSGTWTVRLENRREKGHAKIHVEAWIQRDDPMIGMPRYGRQSHFEDARYRRFDAVGRLEQWDDEHGGSRVKRSGAISGIANGKKTVVVGAIRGDDGRPSAYSGRAHSAKPGVVNYRPDVATVADRSWNRRGVLAASTRSGGVFSMDGTSVAAAQVARIVGAKRLVQLQGFLPHIPRPQAVDESHGQQKVRDEAVRVEHNLPAGWVPSVDPTRSGIGRIDPAPIVPPLPPKTP